MKKQETDETVIEEELEEYTRELCIKYSLSTSRPEDVLVRVEYYPYTSLKHTIRRRKSGTKELLYIRLSDTMRDAPRVILEALLMVMLAKIYPRRFPPELIKHTKQIYNQFVNSKEFREAVITLRQRRARKKIWGPRGRVHNLEESFERVNSLFFENNMEKPLLTWSERNTVKVMGHQDEAMGTVVISKSLDDERVPYWVVDYVVYHELLHFRFPPAGRWRRKLHSREFETEIRRFPRWKEAEEYLTRIAEWNRRRRRRR